MSALRSIFSGLYTQATGYKDARPLAPIVYCDVLGTLIQRDGKAQRSVLNKPLESFLLWLLRQDIAVQVMSTEPEKMFDRLKLLRINAQILGDENTILSKSALLSQDSRSEENLGVIIDDDPLQFRYSKALIVDVNDPDFRTFLTGLRYSPRHLLVRPDIG